MFPLFREVKNSIDGQDSIHILPTACIPPSYHAAPAEMLSDIN